MLRNPFGSKARYSFVLTSDGLELGSPDPAVAPIRVPLPPGVLGPDASGDLSSLQLHDPQALQEALAACLRQVGRPVRHAHLALDGMLIRTVTLPIPFVPPREELELAVRAEAERYRVFAGAEVASDFSLLDSDESALTVLLAAARRDDLDRVVEVFEGAGIAVSSVEPAPLALLRGLAAGGEAPQSCGVIAAFPQQIHVSSWEREALHSWRTLYVRASELRDGEPLAIAETTLELQRSLLTASLGRCFLVDVPEPLGDALTMPEGVTSQVLPSTTPEGGSVALRGALLYGPERGPFVFDLRPDRLKAPRPRVTRGVLIPLAFAMVLIAALGANVWLSDRVKAHEAAAERLQSEIQVLQAQLTAPDGRRESEEALREAMTRSEAVVALFRRFQDDTPHDVWLSRTALREGAGLTIEGYALSRQAPLLLAEALGRSRSLTGIEVPEVAEERWQGEPVYRFRLQAVFAPQGTFRP